MRSTLARRPAAGLHETLRRITGAAPVLPSSSGLLVPGPGAYLLLLELDRALTLAIPRFAGVTFAPRRYLYAGSARGPGGIAARVGRHFRPDKSLHWHIDHLTVAASGLAAFCVSGGSECALLRAVLACGGFHAVARGFGSSDCRSCDSHLLQAEAGLP